MMKGRTKGKLASGETAFGTFTLVPEPSLVELVGAAGYDFIGIDTEHAAADGRTVENMIRAAQAVDMTPFVRVRHIEEKELLWVLDSGAEGIVIPMLPDAAAARAVYELTHYPPLGRRTVCSATRAAGRGAYREDFGSFVASVNDNLLLMGLIETLEAANEVKDIVNEGIDILLVGRADISMKMGYDYAPDHPKVVELTKRVLGTVMESGKTAGILAYGVDEAIDWIDFGCELVMFSQPEILLAKLYADALKAMKEPTR